MGDSYKINNNDGIYFITITVIGWVDLFTRKEYRDIIIESLKYCQNNKGLVLYAYVIMSNHVHMMISVEEGFEAQNIVRDFKKFTSKEIIKRIKEIGESRR
ncbi:MAG: transposase, partial [Cyclobacteriaceae bacterium]|nr:transposase [Cyclobacteriaceae bacterium]